MTEQTVIEILDSLGSEYSKKWSENEKSLKLRTWMTILKDVTDEQGWKGLEKALNDPGEFMPSVGKFKQMCLSGAGCSSIEDEALRSWSIVMSYLNHTISPIFKNSVIAETIRNMGGWKRLCSMLETEEPFRKKDFIDLYLVNKRSGQDFNPLLRGVYDDYKFIGYQPGDNLKKLH